MTDALLGAADVRRIAAEIGLSPTKKWGQNFVIDPNTVRRIVEEAHVNSQDVVVEVGPGIGSLTLALLPVAQQVVALEIDERLASRLPTTVSEFAPNDVTKLTVVHQDAMEVEALSVAPTKLVANLPYNVSVPVLLHFFKTFPTIQEALVMVQSEVGERLAAKPGNKIYGVPSVKAAWYADVSIASSISRNVFWPVPNVDSVLVRFIRHQHFNDEQLRLRTFDVVDAAFGQRRKTLRSALSSLCGSSKMAETVLATAGVDAGLRGEQLDLDAFIRIAAAIQQVR